MYIHACGHVCDDMHAVLHLVTCSMHVAMPSTGPCNSSPPTGCGHPGPVHYSLWQPHLHPQHCGGADSQGDTLPGKLGYWFMGGAISLWV